MNNKRAQVSETMTWIVATVIILIILLVSVYLASLVGQSKAFPVKNQVDLFAHKSLTAYLLTKDSQGTSIYNQISTEEQLNDFNGNLASKIFSGLYSGYYNNQLFLGMAIDSATCFSTHLLNYADFLGTGYCTSPNKYFSLTSASGGALESDSAVINLINLKDNKYLQLVLWHTN